MTSTIQRAELQAQIWMIANYVRGSVDGWGFKYFVLGTLFYRFISKNVTNYTEGGDDSMNYAELPDDVITPEIRPDAIKTKGYFIYPSQLSVNVAAKAKTKNNILADAHIAQKEINETIYWLELLQATGYLNSEQCESLNADAIEIIKLITIIIKTTKSNINN